MSAPLIQSWTSTQHSCQRQADNWRAIAVCGLLVLAVLLVFSRTLSQGFLNYDDNYFVYEEPHVSGGLSWSGIAWAFTDGPGGEWYPLSMLSHQLDCQLYGLNPTGHHLTNLLLHAVSAVALFLVLWRMTGGLWPSALVAAIFAFHPLHVESVAWVAERRDVLSGLFFMLTLGAYGEYVRRPHSLGRYFAVVGLFALGLLAKPILVTLPPLLLLLDYWPLGRFERTPPETGEPFRQRVLLDKLPLFALSIAAGVATMLTHNPWLAPLTLLERLANAAVSSVAYLWQLFVPVGLSIFYAHPEAGRPVWQVAAAAALLLAITVAATAYRRSYPYFFVGWFWYVGMLLPVLGLSYVGHAARADRYTYLSQIGLSIALVWGGMKLTTAWPARRWVLGTGSAMVLAALLACTWRQTGHWQNPKTLWEHALACDPKNVHAHYLLGQALRQTDDTEAAAQYRLALEIGPHEQNIYRTLRAQTHVGLGDIATRKGNIREAIAHCERALELDSTLVMAHQNLAILLAKNGNFDKAMILFQRCIDLAPDGAAIYCNLAVALAQGGKTDEAIANFRRALKIDPDSGAAHSNLADLLASRDDVDKAISHVHRAIKIDPDVPFPYYQMAKLLRRQGKASEAARYDEHGRKVSHRHATTQNRRGAELAQEGKLHEAIVQFRNAVAIAPDYAPAHHNLADALAMQGKVDHAISHYRRALEIDPSLGPARQSLERLSNR